MKNDAVIQIIRTVQLAAFTPKDFTQTKMNVFFYEINNTSWRKPVFRCHVINLYLKSLFSNKTTIFTKIKLSIDVKFESRRWTVLRKKKPIECPSCPCSKYLKLCGALCHTRIFVQASPFSKKKKKNCPSKQKFYVLRRWPTSQFVIPFDVN